ncbi:MAG: molybdopterin adenylyltransferase [Gemmatimonadetes bacterium]|nr:molybdopterin adenylyltransferase [Gemmatimonadota bacterium]MCY3676816.1 molybdopterin adenylyltransferase [Gemmatimonadota bacterium]MYA43070.1 molybdopterin adenylyltransferase [Gemmatimonadota bacterium]MYE92711.1 molybdopterin adenylyltransferase [Gemmatimonadota bacterium]MYJ12586.1 molybdopterin adenylyltransferase [Gemmatimonadota bacterium]
MNKQEEGRDTAAGRVGDESATTPVRIGIVVVSDRASRGEYEDRGGPAVREYLADVLVTSWQAEVRVIPDERDLIGTTLVELVDDAGCCLVITTGGTGPAPRDVTPEATAAVLEKELAGFGEAMRAVSRPHVPTAILSRQTAGVRGSALIINLPGSPKAVRECLDAVFAAVPDCVDLIGGPYLETDRSRVVAYRPHGP